MDVVPPTRPTDLAPPQPGGRQTAFGRDLFNIARSSVDPKEETAESVQSSKFGRGRAENALLFGHSATLAEEATWGTRLPKSHF